MVKITDSCKITYPGKNHNRWQDLKQLMDQMTHAIDISEHLHSDKVAIWLFDCSSAHKGLTRDALNVNNMKVNSGGKLQHLHTTSIPANNPPPKLGCSDTHSQLQDMVYPTNHPDSNL